MTNRGNLLISGGIPEAESLAQVAAENLSARLARSPAYNLEEILEIEQLDKRLFPATFEISYESRETLRVLCSYSRCELRPASSIRSHRKFIGPVIVFLKKLSWPLMRFHLKETFESMQLFHSWVVYSYARQVLKLEVLQKQHLEFCESVRKEPPFPSIQG